VRRCGMPAHVASSDDGNHFTYFDGGASVDALVDSDQALVRALVVRADAPQVMTLDNVGGRAQTFAFGSYTQAQADADLTNVADYSFENARAYRLDAARELVLTFDPLTKRLARVAIGERATLVRVNALPRPLDQPPFPYTAPVLKHTAVPSAAGGESTIVRLDVDRDGIVRNVAVLVPSDDAAADSALRRALADDAYAPARLAGRPIGASVYREIRR